MVKKNCRLSLLLLLLLTQGQANAEDQSSVGFWEVLPETVLRPVGLMGFVGGCAMFLVATPITAVASIEAPHDAWFNSFNGFVGAPVRYTFTRPIGDYSFKVYPD
jgi:hypothetical protein